MYRVLKSGRDNGSKTEDYNLYKEFTLEAGGETEENADGQDNSGRSAGDQLLEDAVRQAERILEDARKGAARIEEEAWQEAYRKGEKEGYKEGVKKAMEENSRRFEEELNDLKQKIARYVKDVGDEKEKLLEQYIDNLKNIALAIGEKIVQTSLKSSEDVIERMILAATEKLKKSAWAKIYIGSGREMLDIQGDAEFLRSLSNLADRDRKSVV